MLIEITVAVMLLKDQEAGRTDDEQARGSGGRRNRRSTARIPRACWLAQEQRGGVVTAVTGRQPGRTQCQHPILTALPEPEVLRPATLLHDGITCRADSAIGTARLSTPSHPA